MDLFSANVKTGAVSSNCLKIKEEITGQNS